MQVVPAKVLNSHGLSPPLASRKLRWAGIFVSSRVPIQIKSFFCFLISFSTLSTVSTNAAESIPFVNIERGSNSGVRERKFLVIKTEAEWKTLWQTHAQPQAPAKELPRVDFDKEMVVAVFLGEKPTGGYRVEITAIEEDRGKG